MKINQLLPQGAEKLTAEDFVCFAIVALKKNWISQEYLVFTWLYVDQ